jgi:hypothetical protein
MAVTEYKYFLYEKTFRDECEYCCEDNTINSIYCLCSNPVKSKNQKFHYCFNDDNYIDNNINISYKNLYMIAKKYNIKKRSVMTNRELYDAVSHLLSCSYL